MTLSEKKKQLFVKWLETKTAISFICPVCTSDDWGVLDDIVILKSFKSYGAYPSVGLICNCCKHIVLFSANESGIMHSNQDPSATVCQQCFKVEASMVKGDDGEYVCLECHHGD